MRNLKLLAVALCLVFVGQLSAKVTLHPIFTDNMVLQQQAEVNIWGEAKPSKEVKIVTSWNNATYTVLSDADGKWKAKILTPKAGGPYTISVADDKKPLVLDNVLIGEVWICSGQSNMEMKMGDKVCNMEQELKDAEKYKNIRLLHVENRTSPVPMETVEIRHGGWQVCSAENVYDFSAAGYFFGKNLNDYLDIPIGLIETCWGGTYAESWTSEDALREMPYFHERLDGLKGIPASREGREELFRKQLDEWVLSIAKVDKGYADGKPVWAEASFDDSDWTTVQVPTYLQDQGMSSTAGYFWLRKTVDIPQSWAGKELKLKLGAIDDCDYTFFNGVPLGHTEGCFAGREYTVPSELVKAGKAAVAIRVLDTGGKGGIIGDPNQIAIVKSDTESILLSGDWKFNMTLGLGDAPEMPVNTATEPNYPAFLYNAMINPLVDFAIAGAIWYQGEANVARASQYGELLPLMINDWREKWGYNFPFYIAQLANFMNVQTEAEESEWAELREAQVTALNLENTGLAVLIDVGEAADIHPKNKQDVGKRLALNALAQTYGLHIPYSGPMYDSYKIEGNHIRLSFNHTEGGLVAKGSEVLEGFYVAGADRVFHKADARIEGDTIVVSSEKVGFPVSVRYAWANNPVCNLYNGAGLPASPFRTDRWNLGK